MTSPNIKKQVTEQQQQKYNLLIPQFMAAHFSESVGQHLLKTHSSSVIWHQILSKSLWK